MLHKKKLRTQNSSALEGKKADNHAGYGSRGSLSLGAVRWPSGLGLRGWVALAFAATLSRLWAQPVAGADAPEPVRADWSRCTAIASAAARLACFDAWAAAHQSALQAPWAGADPTAGGQRSDQAAAGQPLAGPARSAAAPAKQPASSSPAAAPDCRYADGSLLTRYWELSAASDCGTFAIRGYKPTSLMGVVADTVNRQPASPAPGHTATGATDFRHLETRVQLSVRTKIAQGLLTHNQDTLRDSLWFAYTQVSHWQLFSPELSRPFRTTDHEPELIYMLPADAPLPGGWRLRNLGVALNHQSNGQSLPLSRSWNRVIAMAGADAGPAWTLTARAWARLPEPAEDDDNPDIADRVGRADFSLWHVLNPRHTLGLTLRHNLRRSAGGAWQLDWFYAPGDARPLRNGLRLHAQLLSGWGDTLIDYNQHRTVLRLGLSLVDW